MAEKPAPKQYLFVSKHRDIVVTSTKGYSILFEKGVPTHAPRAIHDEVMEKGVLPCDASGEIMARPEAMEEVAPSAPKVMVAPEDGEEREAAIKAAIEKIVERNDSADFTAGGMPKAAAVTALVGWKVDSNDVRPVWADMREEVVKGEGGGKK